MKRLVLVSIILFLFVIPNLNADALSKITSGLKEVLNSQNTTPMDKVDVLIRVKGNTDFRSIKGNARKVISALKRTADTSQEDLLNYLRKTDSEDIEPFYIVNLIHAAAPKSVIYDLAKRDDVEMIYHDDIVRLFPVFQGDTVKTEGAYEWNLTIMNVDKARNAFGLSGKNVVIGHIDTGIDANHKDLKGKVIGWKDCISDKPDPYDDQGHGTHTAGTIAGGNNSGKYIGMAPDVKLVVAKVFSSSGGAQSSDIMEAMEYMLDPDGDPDTNDAPRLVSNSWGSSTQTNTVYWEAVNAWVNANIFPSFAAGNSGPGAKTVGTPGGFPHSFAVGATDNSDKIAYFSSRGPIFWENIEWIKPDVSAPGKDIPSAWPGGGYKSISGTSMACPAVSGVIALLYEANPDLSIDTIREILESTGKDLGDAGKDNVFGSCRIDAYQALVKVLDSGKLAGKVTDSGTGKGIASIVKVVENDFTFKTDKAGKYQVTLQKGKYNAEFSVFGYISKKAGFEVIKGKTTNLNVSLKRAPLGLLQGTVKNAAGEPLKAIIHIAPLENIATDPDTGSFAIEIPNGTYEIKVSSWGHATEIRSNVVVSGDQNENFILEKLPPVLLVDDDKNTKCEEKYIQGLQDNNVDYTYFEYTKDSVISLDLVGQYPVVFWSTGKDYGTSLTDSDQDLLKEYLSSGGNLFVSGQDIGYDIKLSAFYKKYLHAEFAGDNAKTNNVSGISGNSLSNGIELDISGDSTVYNQNYPDYINVTNGKALYKYSTGQIAGVNYNDNTYKLVYLAFGFEGIKGRATRKKVLKNITSYLIPKSNDNLIKLQEIYLETKKSFSPDSDVMTDRVKRISDRIINSIETDVKNGNMASADAMLSFIQKSTVPEAFGYLLRKIRELAVNSKSYGWIKIADKLLK